MSDGCCASHDLLQLRPPTFKSCRHPRDGSRRSERLLEIWDIVALFEAYEAKATTKRGLIRAQQVTEREKMDDENFHKLQKGLSDALSDIFDAYVGDRRGPLDQTVGALADIIDCSPNELRKMFAKHARSKGSNLFFMHYPAFGQPGCEYEGPVSN